ncbi:hypothetical protein CDV55_107208 [Aspergillus turcosus]|nr:hypothetical protein CDV55_107208 [Aspergillus turcosus]
MGRPAAVYVFLFLLSLAPIYWKRDVIETRLSILGNNLLEHINGQIRLSEDEQNQYLVFVGQLRSLVVHQSRQSETRVQSRRRSYQGNLILGHTAPRIQRWPAQALHPLGSNPLLLANLGYDSKPLLDLHELFVDSVESDLRVFNFYEQRAMQILRRSIKPDDRANEKSSVFVSNSQSIVNKESETLVLRLTTMDSIKADGEWLVIIDNADDFTWGIKKKMPQGAQGRLIITSRDDRSEMLVSGGCEQVRVGTMTPQEGKIYNKAVTNWRRDLDTSRLQLILQYLEDYDRHRDELLQMDDLRGLSPTEKTVWTSTLTFLAHFKGAVIQDELFRLASLGMIAVDEELGEGELAEMWQFIQVNERKWDIFDIDGAQMCYSATV